MLTTIFAFLVAAIALGVVGWIVRRHWKEIRLLNPLSIKEEQERQTREDLIRRRFERLQHDHTQPFARLGRKGARALKRAYSSAYERLQSFESFYKNVKSPFAAMTPTTRERIKTLLAEARSLARDLKWADAERRYLEVLSFDPRQAEVYKGLGQIYLKQKLYPQAKETFEFLLKIKKADDAAYAAFAEIAESEGNVGKAEAMRIKAAEMSARHAHRHAELAEFYLGHQEFAKAWVAVQKVMQLEPQSAKYTELALEIALARRDNKEAQFCYDRLRLVSEDHTRFQYWRDKVEALKLEQEKGQQVKDR